MCGLLCLWEMIDSEKTNCIKRSKLDLATVLPSSTLDYIRHHLLVTRWRHVILHICYSDTPVDVTLR